MSRKSLVSVLLTLSLVFGLTAACSQGGSQGGGQGQPDPQPTTQPSPQTGGAEEPQAEEKGSKITDEPLELTIHMHYGNRFAFDDEWSIFKKAAELTNISLKGVTPSTSTNSQEMGNLMLASGNLPDIIHMYYTLGDIWGPDGVLIDLKDLVEQHAPNIKKMLDENPRLRRLATAEDGNMYFIPSPNNSVVAKGWLIRQDWLDEVGRPVPDTVDEFYETLKAFKEVDPKRYPYIARGTMDIRDLLSFWGLSPERYMTIDGKAVLTASHPDYKPAVQTIAKWYAEGLIDQEIFTRGSQAREIMFGDNLAGVTHDFFQSTTGFNISLQEKVPGFHIIAMAPPINVHGERLEPSKGNFYFPHGWGISSQSKHPVEAIKYFDFWFSEEGMMLGTYGVEGETYVVENGELDLTDDVKEGNILENLYKVGAQLEFPYRKDPDFVRFTTSEEAMRGLKMYEENDYMMEPFPPFEFTAKEKERYDELSAAISSYVDEQFQKWVMGKEVLDDAVWENYLRELDRLGLQEMTELAQLSYDRSLED